jgi:hypothetical protein
MVAFLFFNNNDNNMSLQQVEDTNPSSTALGESKIAPFPSSVTTQPRQRGFKVVGSGSSVAPLIAASRAQQENPAA